MFRDPQHHQLFEKYISVTEMDKSTIWRVKICFFLLFFIPMNSVFLRQMSNEMEHNFLEHWSTMLRHHAAENSLTISNATKKNFSLQ